MKKKNLFLLILFLFVFGGLLMQRLFLAKPLAPPVTKKRGIEKTKAILSAFLIAIFLGIISPKTMIKKVIIPVANPRIAPTFWIPLPSKNEIIKDVASTEAPIFAMLLPIKTTDKSLLGSSLSFFTSFAP